jgi:hypothetical protein
MQWLLASGQCVTELEQLRPILEDRRPALSIDFDRLLRCAISLGDLEICKYLIEFHAANPRSRDTLGLSPVIYAGFAHRKRVAILKYLANTMGVEAFRKELYHPDSSGRNAMHYALCNHPAYILHFYYMQGANTEGPNEDLNTNCKSGKALNDGQMLVVLLYTKFQALLKVPLWFCGNPVGETLTPWFEFSGTGTLDQPDFSVAKMMGCLKQWIHVPSTNV